MLERRRQQLNALLAEAGGGLGRRGHASSLDNVLFVVMGSMFKVERALLQRLTWCQHAACVFAMNYDAPPDQAREASRLLEDAGARRIAPILTGGRDAGSCCEEMRARPRQSYKTREFCLPHRMDTLEAQYHFLPTLAWAKKSLRINRSIDWVALVDDDSFVFPRSVRRLLASYPRPADESLFLGDFFNYAGGTVMEGGAPRPYRRREAEWDDKRRRGTYACGGGGSVFSRRALEAMDLGRCMRDYHKKCMQSDWMIADCARKFNVTFAVEHGCTCAWSAEKAAEAEAAVREGSCAFMQNPLNTYFGGDNRAAANLSTSPLLALLRRAQPLPPAIVHGLERLLP